MQGQSEISEIRETLQMLGWGNGQDVHFYDNHSIDVTSTVHRLLDLTPKTNPISCPPKQRTIWDILRRNRK